MNYDFRSSHSNFTPTECRFFIQNLKDKRSELCRKAAELSALEQELNIHTTDLTILRARLAEIAWVIDFLPIEKGINILGAEDPDSVAAAFDINTNLANLEPGKRDIPNKKYHEESLEAALCFKKITSDSPPD